MKNLKNVKYTNSRDVDILARTLYGEARGEVEKFGLSSIIAVANVVVNRFKKKFAKTISEVCLAPNQFSCWNKNDPNYQIIKNVDENDLIFRKCLVVAQNVIEGKYPDITDGCDHYHACYAKPYWAAYHRPKRIFGTHCFYCLINSKI